MKHPLFLLLGICLLSACTPAYIAENELPFSVDSVGRQVLVITPIDSSIAQADFYCSERGGWLLCRSEEAYIGKYGAGKMREGDAKTPVGYYGVVSAFGIQPNPGTKLPYIEITPTTVGVDGEGDYYNQIIDTAVVKVAVTGEDMYAAVPDYYYGLTTTYNQDCVPGMGSCVFIHCKGNKPYTGGCIALSEDFMVALLRCIDEQFRFYVLPEKQPISQ